MTDANEILFFGGLIVAAVAFILLRIDMAAEQSRAEYRNRNDI
jgi:hypothetical protein